ncbi:hypothetical protein SMGD1_1156 [Sulfurimonas gotlandica GD1]|uniref:Uncharacterized protein n=1 Tax=Sulfurimonas gotlandica (strain DSM 19862 / JCM 16533 / GD1) TaxID=929558 RepID=B6BGP9_SULGG|nr:DUF6781 family protein [Sulfurimonas gotlandica]EDZ63290.1 conserved hypothetical protein [Sulfurimonas gotlandica GD1]EHP29680.1 hypothetical protein SMGD1_1156 [Sulfurimonas gotlandica GD1]
MDLEKLNSDLTSSYNHRFKSVDKRVAHIMNHLSDDLNIQINDLNLHEIKTIATTILDIETLALKSDVESLLAQKELIERNLEKKSEELQQSKYNVFNAIETQLESKNEALSKLHQVKLQSIDLYDFLSEMVESAIITALEKDTDGDIKETTQEVIKDITFEAIKEGSLNTIRIRKILSTILHSAVDIAEASPTKADDILNATLHGMRSGLIRSIDRFKKRLAYMPVEAKHILIEDYDTIMEDLNQTDTLFSQVVQTQASENTQEIRKILLDINKDMHYDLEELVHISKETADVMRERFSSFAKTAVKKADTALKSEAAQEAKRMGKQAWGVAKTALGSAIKTAKGAIDNKDK